MSRAMTIASLAASTIVLSSCTYVVSSDTGELRSRVEALSARITELESSDPAVAIATLKSELASHQQLIRQLTQRRADRTPHQAPRPQKPLAQAQPAPEARRRPNARKGPEGGDRHVERAQAIGKRAGLDEGQTAQLAKILKARQERMALAMKSVRDQKMPKDQAAEYRKNAKQQNDAMIAEFGARLSEEQVRKLEEALQARKRPDGARRHHAEGQRRKDGDREKNRPDRGERKKKERKSKGDGDQDRDF